MDEPPLKQYPFIGVCGLDCGLCTRYHTEGSSRCFGCAGQTLARNIPPADSSPVVSNRSTSRLVQNAMTGQAAKKLVGLWKGRNGLIRLSRTGPLAANFTFIQKYSIEEFARLEMAKMELLGYLLEHFDEGRSKTFYCTGCQLLPLDSLKAALAEAEMTINESADIKEKSQLVRAAISRLADALSVDLKLRN